MTKRWLIALLLALVLIPAFAQSKTIITVLDFSTDGVSRSEMRTIITLLSSALFQTKSFTVIDVSERDRLLQELQFSVSECSDESCLLEVGRMLSAEAIVVGNIGKVGNRYVLSTKMLETETARTLNTADGIYSNLDALVDDIVNVAKKLAKGLEQPGAVAKEGAAEPAKTEPEKVTKAPKEKPAKAPRPVKERAPVEAGTGRYWSLSAGAGLNIPVGPASQALGLGIPALLELDYHLPLGGGSLALGAVTGFQFQRTRPDVRYLYSMLTEPLGAAVSYRLNGLLPFYLSFGAMGGVTFNEVRYKEAYEFRQNGLNISAFAAPVLALGYQVSPRLGIELTVPYWLIFFQGATVMGVSPTLGVEFALGAGAAGTAPVEKPVKERAPVEAGTGKYWSLSAGAGLNIPVGPTSQALGLAVPALFELDYHLPLGGGSLALGAVTGFQYQATRKDVRYLYTMLTEPLGAAVSYRLNGLLPFYLSFGAMGGVTFNEVLYKETYDFRQNGLNISAFAAPVLALGYQLSPKLGLELTVPYWLIFFQGAVYMGISPVVGVEIRL